MQVSPLVLPKPLRTIAENIGLEYPTAAPGSVMSYPVAGKTALGVNDTAEQISRMPVQMNFHRCELDMSNPEDVEEYERIMNYNSANYGMQVIYLERKFVKCVKTEDGKKTRVLNQRIFIEYYAPYFIAQ